MSNVGERERVTQNRVIEFFQAALGNRYLSVWNSEKTQGVMQTLIIGKTRLVNA